MLVLVEETAAKYRTNEPSACCGKSPAYHGAYGGTHDLDDIRCPHCACAPRRYVGEGVGTSHGPGIEIWRRCRLDILFSIRGCKGIVSATDIDESRVGKVGRDDRTI